MGNDARISHAGEEGSDPYVPPNSAALSLGETYSKEGMTYIATRKVFRHSREWDAAMELVRRGSYKIVDRVQHLTWEWIAIEPI